MVKIKKTKVMQTLVNESGSSVKLGLETMRLQGAQYMTYSKAQKTKPKTKVDLSDFMVIKGNKFFRVEK